MVKSATEYLNKIGTVEPPWIKAEREAREALGIPPPVIEPYRKQYGVPKLEFPKLEEGDKTFWIVLSCIGAILVALLIFKKPKLGIPISS